MAMQALALNFLTEKPSTNWFDFIVDPANLNKHLLGNVEPRSDQLIYEFCQQALQEATLAECDTSHDIQTFRFRKLENLWLLSFRVASHLSWNLASLRRSLSLSMMRTLLLELLRYTARATALYTLKDLCSLPKFLAGDGSQQFAVILYCRWIVHSCVHEHFLQPPPKITVSNPSVQPDPSVFIADQNTRLLQEIMQELEVASSFLNSLVLGFSNGHSMFPTDSISLDVDEFCRVSLQISQLMCQINFDLTELGFFQQNYSGAREYCVRTKELFQQQQNMHDHFTIDVATLHGYSVALALDPTIDGHDASAHITMSSPMDIDLRADKRIHTNSSLSISCATGLVAIGTGLDGPCSTIDTLLDPRIIAKPYISRFIAAVRSNARIGSVLHSGREKPSKFLVKSFEPLWQLLFVVKPSVLKQMFVRVPQGSRVSSFWTVPSTAQAQMQKLPITLNETMVTYLCKAEQVCNAGDNELCTEILEAAATELTTPALSSSQICSWQALYYDLLDWHAKTALLPDANMMGGVTKNLAKRVKSLIADTHSTPPPQELFMLCGVFLLNTCDFDFAIKQSASGRSRFLDFVKLFSALCYDLSKGGANVGLLAKEIFDYLQMTMNDAVQQKRTQGGRSESIQRESSSLLITRAQLTILLKLLREPLPMSMLLSYLIKLLCGVGIDGLPVSIYVEHADIWPSKRDLSEVNAAFIRTAVGVALESALMIEPTRPSWLRSAADFAHACGLYTKALQYYVQCAFACSDFFTTDFSVNVLFNDDGVRKMMACCSQLQLRMLEALLTQLLRESDPTNTDAAPSQQRYQLALKALEEATTTNLDANVDYFSAAWDVNLLEFIFYQLNKSNNVGKLTYAEHALSTPELNASNRKDVLWQAVAKRKRKLMLALFDELFCLGRSC